MKSKPKEKLPPFPKTPHLPYRPNLGDDDVVCEAEEASVVFAQNFPVNIEEKIDGASVGITIDDGHFVCRNRDKFLSKGNVKNTAAKKQFASLWNWLYDHEEALRGLLEESDLSLYGEWCLARHGIAYVRLPDWFVGYDLYDAAKSQFLDPVTTRAKLEAAGIATPPLLFQGVFEGDAEDLVTMANWPSAWADEAAEGIYTKVYSPYNHLVHYRYKMVREDFARGRYWQHDQITKNERA